MRAAVIQRAGVGDGGPSQLAFTPAAKEVLALGLREALWLGSNYIGTEHILLGLVLETEGVAAGILLDFGAGHERLRSEVIGVLWEAGYRPPSAARSARQSAGMFESFTDRARRVIVLAQRESGELGHDHIGGEHILLGLLREREGVAGRALEALGVTLEHARAGVLERVPAGKPAPAGQRPFTPRANQIIDLALRETLMLRHSYIGTEHILLGLIRRGKSNATDVLVDLGADPRKVRAEVLNRMSEPTADAPAERSQPERLTAQEEVELAKRIERGEPDAKEQMAENNRRLVSSIADEYRGRGLSREELKRAGSHGLVRATDTFDYRKGHRFSSYATHWIRQAIVQALAKQSR